MRDFMLQFGLVVVSTISFLFGSLVTMGIYHAVKKEIERDK